MATAKTEELRALAQRVADAFPPEVSEVVLTGSVSRGVADEVSDVEMLVVTESPLSLEEAYVLARGTGLESLDSWGAQGLPAKRVSGYLDGQPFELIFWPRSFAEDEFESLLGGKLSSSAEAIANGVSLRKSGLLAEWQECLSDYPEELAAARIEEAALPWGGSRPRGCSPSSGPASDSRSRSGCSTARYACCGSSMRSTVSGSRRPSVSRRASWCSRSSRTASPSASPKR